MRERAAHGDSADRQNLWVDQNTVLDGARVANVVWCHTLVLPFPELPDRMSIPQTSPTAHTLPVAGAATGTVRVLLQLESAAMLIVLLGAYQRQDAGWGLFAALFLVPDLAMLPYLRSKAAGAAAYNAAHSFVVPALLVGMAAVTDSAVVLSCATIWSAHIAFDRALGYGLKYPTGFNDTHLGRTGRAPAMVDARRVGDGPRS
jgi:Domain of unknown function (DUF4260)